MAVVIYETRADYRARAEKHFRNAENKMLECFPGMEKGYTSKANGWDLTIECDGDVGKIDLMRTCKWNVRFYEDIKTAVISFEMDGNPYELVFSVPVLFGEDEVQFLGMRKLK